MKFYVFILLFIHLTLQAEIHLNFTEKNCSVIMNIQNEKLVEFEPLKLTLKLNYPSGYSVDENQIKNHLLWQINILDKPWIIKSVKQLDKNSIFFELYPIQTGENFLHLNPIVFENIEAKNVTIQPSVVAIDVSENYFSVDTQYAPLISLGEKYPIFLNAENRKLIAFDEAVIRQNNYEFNLRTFPYKLLLVLASISFLVWLLLLISKKRKLEKANKPEDLTEIIHKRFKLIEQEISQKQYKQAYLNCVEMITNQFGFSKYSEEQKKSVDQILEKSFLVKYANEIPSLDECQQALELVKSSVYF